LLDATGVREAARHEPRAAVRSPARSRAPAVRHGHLPWARARAGSGERRGAGCGHAIDDRRRSLASRAYSSMIGQLVPCADRVARTSRTADGASTTIRWTEDAPRCSTSRSAPEIVRLRRSALRGMDRRSTRARVNPTAPRVRSAIRTRAAASAASSTRCACPAARAVPAGGRANRAARRATASARTARRVRWTSSSACASASIDAEEHGPGRTAPSSRRHDTRASAPERASEALDH
jgi:hypothetical protein